MPSLKIILIGIAVVVISVLLLTIQGLRVGSMKKEVGALKSSLTEISKQLEVMKDSQLVTQDVLTKNVASREGEIKNKDNIKTIVREVIKGGEESSTDVTPILYNCMYDIYKPNKEGGFGCATTKLSKGL